MSKPAPTVWTRVWHAVGSMKLAAWLFVLLGILTFAGTLEQRDMSLYDVQAKYFESWVLVWWAGGVVPVPLLGGYLLLKVLFVNLLVGGVIRIRKGTGTVGVLIAHIGILLLLMSSFVEYHFSTKGQMRLIENETSSEYKSVYEWEVVVAAPDGDGQREYVIPWESFKDLDLDETVRWTHADLPFDVVLSDVSRNAQPQPAQPGDQHAIDGFVLARLKPTGSGGRVNVPGLIATLHPKDGGTPAMRSILWGLQEFPWDPTIGDTRYLVDLRQRTWSMPFSVRLDRFEHEMHPGITMAKRYSSFVTKIDGSTQERAHITMNEPLRWRGYTLYQSDYGPKPNEPPGTPTYSVFSVVQNPADKWPEWMLYLFIFPGMLLHFTIKLVRWINRELALRRRAATVLVLVGALLLAGCDATTGDDGGWNESVQETAVRLPVQADGRVKPLSTWAAFSLLGMNHRRSCKDAEGNTLLPTEWVLDAMFRPARARTHACVIVPTSEVLVAIGHEEIAKKKRDRYSYDELNLPDARAQLAQQAEVARRIPAKDRTRVQEGVLDLENSLALLDGLFTFFDWARKDQELGDPSLEAAFGGRKAVPFTDVLAASSDLIKRAEDEMRGADEGQEPSAEAQAIGSLLMRTFGEVDGGLRIGLLPPVGEAQGDEQTWLTLRTAAGLALLRGVMEPQHLEALRAMERMARASAEGEAFDAAAFEQGLQTWHDAVVPIAETRGEYDEVAREVRFYALDPFHKSLVIYIIATLLVVLAIARLQSRWAYVLAFGTTAFAFVLQTYGIVLRCLIRGRPPISTLYETVIFIGATGVLALLVIELLTKRRIGLLLAPILGTILLFIAGRYEVLNGTDTMPQLVAVLDTNYWLALHVTCISLGYMAGLVAALIAHVYVFAKFVGLTFGKNAPGLVLPGEWYRFIAKLVYGTLCLALLLSLVGTILGGVWANDSWGRFWGWDPKENGALLIVLAQLAILHARMAGMFKALGLCLATIFQAMIVAFSWWGVNLLGIGLHSYGFTSGISNALTVFYCAEGAVLLLGAYVALKERELAGQSSVPPPLPLDEGSSSS